MKHTLILILPILWLAGCNNADEKSETNSPPFAGRVLNLHIPENAELRDFLEPYVDEWNARTGGEASIVEFATVDGLDPQPGDVILTRLADMSRFTTQLVEIPEGTPGREELAWNRLFRGLRERVTKRSDEPRVVPISTPTWLCYYRQDLLEAAGLEPPRTWLEYNKLVESLETWAPGLRAVEPWHADHRATMLFARTIAYASPPDTLSLFFDIESGEPRIDTEGFIRGLEHFKAVAPAFADCWDMTPTQCRTALLTGKAAIGIAIEPATRTQELERPDSMRLGFCRLPGAMSSFNQSLGEWTTDQLNQPAFVGRDGYAAGILSPADRPTARAAASLVATIAEATVAQSASPICGFTCQWQSDVAPSLYEPGLNIDEATALVQATVDSLSQSQVIQDLPIREHISFRRAVSKHLTAKTIADRTPADILGDIKNAWTNLASDSLSLLINDYRQNIGIRKK